MSLIHQFDEHRANLAISGELGAHINVFDANDALVCSIHVKTLSLDGRPTHPSVVRALLDATCRMTLAANAAREGT